MVKTDIMFCSGDFCCCKPNKPGSILARANGRNSIVKGANKKALHNRRGRPIEKEKTEKSASVPVVFLSLQAHDGF